MTYHEAIHFLESCGQRKKLYPIYLRLERLNLIFETLNIDPASPAIHIAGTSGKGSTSSLTAAVLQEAGYKVGLHTTPHLQTPRERMQVNGRMPSEQEFADTVERVAKAMLEIEDNHAYGAFSTQEILFTVAALYFKEQNVDIAVVETFMGGQYDPTNVIRPLISVITNVDLDHTRLLGKTVEAIALVKAGVIKADTPFITSATQQSVLRIFKQRCQRLHSPCIIVGQGSNYRSRQLGQRGSILSAQVLDKLFANLHLRLMGRHQINNALLVLYIIQTLRSRGWLIDDEAIRGAFAKIFIPGRLEIVDQDPLVILDGAHNPAKAKALAGSLKKIFRQRKVIFVFAMKKGKDLELSLRPLLPLAKKFIVTRFSEKRSRSTKSIAKAITDHGIPATIRLDPLAALALAKKQCRDDDYICVTGSLYLVGKVRDYWHPADTLSDNDRFDESVWGKIVGEPIRAIDLPLKGAKEYER